jgi:phenylpyruvate tautomerase PptA (4-oxalocrotonate tautomerase family)
MSDRRREEMTKEMTAQVLDAAGLTPEDGIRVWILMHEVPEGSWGAGGGVVRFEALREAAKAEREAAAVPAS